jgi:hypothetical protein
LHLCHCFAKHNCVRARTPYIHNAHTHMMMIHIIMMRRVVSVCPSVRGTKHEPQRAERSVRPVENSRLPDDLGREGWGCVCVASRGLTGDSERQNVIYIIIPERSFRS